MMGGHFSSVGGGAGPSAAARDFMQKVETARKNADADISTKLRLSIGSSSSASDKTTETPPTMKFFSIEERAAIEKARAPSNRLKLVLRLALAALGYYIANNPQYHLASRIAAFVTVPFLSLPAAVLLVSGQFGSIGIAQLNAAIFKDSIMGIINASSLIPTSLGLFGCYQADLIPEKGLLEILYKRFVRL